MCSHTCTLMHTPCTWVHTDTQAHARVGRCTWTCTRTCHARGRAHMHMGVLTYAYVHAHTTHMGVLTDTHPVCMGALARAHARAHTMHTGILTHMHTPVHAGAVSDTHTHT